MSGHRVVVLGSGQDAGVPQLGTFEDLPERTASSVAVVAPDGRVLLLDASPDLRHQWLALARSGLAGASPTVTGAVLTHGHMGHYAGLLQFGREAAAFDHLPVWCTAAFAGYLVSNQPWASLVSDGHVGLKPVAAGGAVEPWPGLDVRLLPVPHRGEHSDTVGISVRPDGGRSLLYLPDIDSWSEWDEADAVVGDHDVALLDATFWSADEVPGRNIADIPHPLVPDTLARFARVADLWLTHLNRTNPLCHPDAPEHELVRAAGARVASDGDVIDL